MKLITDLQKEENMTREEANKALPILQAFAEGKVIEYRTKPSSLKDSETPNEWTEMKEFVFLNNTEYRIKPKYRPFENKEECWQEMLKHQPFAWIKEKYSDRYNLITEVNGLSIRVKEVYLFTDSFKYYTFADGTPFGIKT